MSNFRSQLDLRQLLISKGIDISKWGTGEAKSLDDLWNEIIAGDSSIQDEPLLRIVDVVQIIIRSGDKVLVEVGQKFHDGRIRSRNLVPSEKKHADESYIDAAYRGLREELQIDTQDVEVLRTTYREKREIKDSNSYPGLRSLYRYHIVDAKVKGLPNTEFWTDERKNEKDPVDKHHWMWKNRPPAPRKTLA